MIEKYIKIPFLLLIFIVKITTLAAAAALTQQGTGTGESSSSSSIVSWSPPSDIDNMNNVDLDMDMMSTTVSSSSHHRQLKSNKHHYYKKRHKKRKHHSKKLKKGSKKKGAAEAGAHTVIDKYCLVKRKKKKKRNTNNAAVFRGSLTTTEGVSTENTPDYTSETMRSNVNNNNNIDSGGQTGFEDDYLLVDLFAPDGLDSLDMDMYDEVVVDRHYYNKKTKKSKKKKKKVSSSSSLQCAQKGKKIYVEEEFTFIVNLHVDSLPFGKTMMDLYNKQVSESILMERTNALSRCYYYLQPQQSLATETTTDVVVAAAGSVDMSDGETQPNGYGKHDSQIVFQKVELISETKLSGDDGTQQRQRQLLRRRTQNEQVEEEARKSITRLDYKFSGITITPVDLPSDEYPCIECVIGDSIVRDVRRRHRHLLINQNLPLQEQQQYKIIEQTCQEFSNRGSLEQEFIQTENPTFTQIDRIYLEKVSNCVSDYSTCVSHFPSFMTGQPKEQQQEFCSGVNLNMGCPVTCCCHYEIDIMENKACKNYFDSCLTTTSPSSSSSTTIPEANARHHDTEEATCPLYYEQDDSSKKEEETNDFADLDFDSFIRMGGRYYSIVDADAPFEFDL